MLPIKRCGRLLGLVIGLACFGCGVDPAEAKRQYDQNKAAGEKFESGKPQRLKAIADDKSLSDLDAIQKGVALFGELKPSVFVKGTKERFEIKEIGGGIPGYMIEVKVYDLTFFAGPNSDNEKLYQYERDSIKQAIDFAAFTLGGLKGRGLKAISYQISSRVEGQPDAEIFRATITLAHLAKLEAAAKEKPEAGSASDPRAQKINEIWKVEANTYSMYDYKKK